MRDHSLQILDYKHRLQHY